MKIKRGMNLDQAYEILNYGDIPRGRDKQISLIAVMGYTKLKGGANGTTLHECPDKQLLRVAGRLFRKAEKVVNEYWRPLEEEKQKEIQDQDQRLYRKHLYDILNISENEGQTRSISELEREVLQ